MPITVVNATRGPVVGDTVEVASSSITRMVGLLGKCGLEPGAGLWIKPSSGVHTFGMKFTIDVIGLDKNNTVIKVWKKLVPNRVTTIHWKMKSVIELPAGRIDECQVQVGDRLTVSA